jgi:hypothetical protein
VKTIVLFKAKCTYKSTHTKEISLFKGNNISISKKKRILKKRKITMNLEKVMKTIIPKQLKIEMGYTQDTFEKAVRQVIKQARLQIMF